MTLFQICPQLERHQKENGGTDMIWFEQHVKTCPICGPIQAAFNQHIRHEFDDAGWTDDDGEKTD